MVFDVMFALGVVFVVLWAAVYFVTRLMRRGN